MAGPMLGVIADDFTGATDIASMLTKGGLRVVQTIGPFSPDFDLSDTDAVVVALKTRSIAADAAVAQSLEALKALQSAGIETFQFKYCSTFDSTRQGNIGPVSDALSSALGRGLVCHIPSLPVNGRTVYKGHLFVHDHLLNESGMQTHPITPMTDANLVRWLGQQSSFGVGLVDRSVVTGGPEAIKRVIGTLGKEGIRHIVGDAIDNSDLAVWAQVLNEQVFFAGGSGLAEPLAKTLSASGRKQAGASETVSDVGQCGQTLILAGSCSQATLRQIDNFRCTGAPVHQIDPLSLVQGKTDLGSLVLWASENLRERSVLIHSSTEPDEVERAQSVLGTQRAAEIVETTLSELAVRLCDLPQTRQIVVAGGETSGAVVSSLEIAAMRIGTEIDPGVPWTLALDTEGIPIIPLALKSGNFGGDDFFVRATRQGGA
ncbi:uncharacterized protein YgbK (DUF1537 family) [Labrenzia sp. EL_142]|nr:uncharacterized protein YgbK (DUF1537 family) [Labrenzia sp. EL_142]MBG6210965.1 uncharacterized protein YgbK (DUF1537 family) [Labrenzia sp. EL_126]